MQARGRSILKKVRLGVSLTAGVLIAAVFLAFAGVLPPALVATATYLQFLPSLLKFINLPTIVAAGFVVVLVATLLFGRVYCSFVCPLGVFQDGCARLARTVNKKRIERPGPRHDWVRFGILGASAVSLIAGSTLLVNLLDPFSSAGRILTHLVRPFVYGGNNFLAWLSELLTLYWPNPVDLPPQSLPAVLIALGTLGVVGWLSYTRGRFYCNVICPVGALLGLVSRVALFKIAINQEDCTSCGLCEKACKGGCIDKKKKTVDFDRCVGCFNCFDVCVRDDMYFTTPWKAVAKPVPSDAGRRKFLQRSSASMALLFLTGGGKTIVPKKLTTVRTGSPMPVSPPGSRSLQHFTATCTACHLCVSACIANVLQPSLFEYGVSGVFQPRMDYRSGYCNYDCTACGDVCPSGAILPLEKEQKKLTQLGIAKFVKDNCIVNTEHTDCGACSEHCPTKAVTMVKFTDKLVIPEVHEEFCIGCGACEHACPTKPFKAIYVNANSVHAVAKKPEVKKAEPVPAQQEDFPF